MVVFHRRRGLPLFTRARNAHSMFGERHMLASRDEARLRALLVDRSASAGCVPLCGRFPDRLPRHPTIADRTWLEFTPDTFGTIVSDDP